MKKYQVLARKYRPQRFSEVVGQETIVTTLKNALRFTKIAHAYLFCGSRGTGKTTLARLFAKALNCQELGQDFEPCNQCSSCKEIIRGQSLDVIEIDGASNRGIDDIRAINETVGYAPTNGRYKIYIIDEVHMLTKEAFNALLKTLEEPPEKAKFFFATTEPHKILPTIISRCQRFDLGRILTTQIIAKLDQIAKDLSRTVESQALHQIAELSDGSLRDAESLLDQILCFVEGDVTAATVRGVFGLIAEEHFFALDQAFTECRLSYAFELVDYLFQTGKDLSHFMAGLIEHYRQIAVCKTLGEQALSTPLSARYMQSARMYTQSQCLYLLEYLLNAETSLQKSLSGRVFLETVLLHIIRSKNRIPVEVLVRRLTELEQSLGCQTQLSPQPTVPERQNLDPPAPAKQQTPPPPIETRETVVQITPKAPLPQEVIAPPVEIKEPAVQTVPKTQVLQETITPPIKPKEPLAQTTIKLEAKQEALTPPAKQKEPVSQTAAHNNPAKPEQHPSHYDTLMRFAAVELEGSLKI